MSFTNINTHVTTTTTTVKLWNISITPKSSLLPFATNPHLPCLPHPGFGFDFVLFCSLFKELNYFFFLFA